MNLKNLLFGCVCGICISLFFSFTNKAYAPKPHTAEVATLNGLMIFNDCMPVSKYESLGTVKTSFFVFDTQYESIRDNLIKRTKAQFPKANGIILKLSRKGFDQCEAIYVTP